MIVPRSIIESIKNILEPYFWGGKDHFLTALHATMSTERHRLRVYYNIIVVPRLSTVEQFNELIQKSIFVRNISSRSGSTLNRSTVNRRYWVYFFLKLMLVLIVRWPLFRYPLICKKSVNYTLYYKYTIEFIV